MLNDIYFQLSSFISYLNQSLFTFIMMPALLIIGVFFSLRTHFVQLRAIKWLANSRLRKLIWRSSPSATQLSNFESFVISSGARIGIGNIVGVALAVQTGGAGALMWMVIAAFFGAATAFSECTLARIYAHSSSGGVAHYIQYGSGAKKLAVAFVFCLVLADVFGFNPLLAHTLNTEFISKFNIHPLAGASLIAVVVGLIFAFGVRFSRIVVPFMLVGYFACTIYVLIAQHGVILECIKMVVTQAFNLQAGFGALLGSAVMIGIKQGLFSNEAGLGSAPNAASAANCVHPCAQGVVQMCAVGFDLAICCASGFLVLSFLLQNDLSFSSAQQMVNAAFVYHFGASGAWIFYFFVMAFCLTSFYGNYYYSTRALSLFSTPPRWFFVLAVLACFVGSLLNAQLAWDLASTLMCAMALINLYAIVRLNKQVKNSLDEFEKDFINAK